MLFLKSKKSMNDKFKIYTKTGDDGTTGLIGGTRVNKWDQHLEAYGTVDELNSWIGLIRSENDCDKTDNMLGAIQNQLFMVGSHLATDTAKSDLHQKLPCDGEIIKKLEASIDQMQEVLPPLTNFILPGGTSLGSKTHIARTVCRRAERRIAALSSSTYVEREIIVFINRLSDYLFVLSRYFNHKKGVEEVSWKPEKIS
jgi:cob(I)alamin adenosyltransferase